MDRPIIWFLLSLKEKNHRIPKDIKIIILTESELIYKASYRTAINLLYRKIGNICYTKLIDNNNYIDLCYDNKFDKYLSRSTNLKALKHILISNIINKNNKAMKLFIYRLFKERNFKFISYLQKYNVGYKKWYRNGYIRIGKLKQARNIICNDKPYAHHILYSMNYDKIEKYYKTFDYISNDDKIYKTLNKIIKKDINLAVRLYEIDYLKPIIIKWDIGIYNEKFINAVREKHNIMIHLEHLVNLYVDTGYTQEIINLYKKHNLNYYIINKAVEKKNIILIKFLKNQLLNTRFICDTDDTGIVRYILKLSPECKVNIEYYCERDLLYNLVLIYKYKKIICCDEHEDIIINTLSQLDENKNI